MIGFIDPDDELAEVTSFQNADEGLRRPFQPIDKVLAIPNAAVGDACTHLPQKGSKLLSCKLIVDEASHRETLRQNLTHSGGQEVRTVTRSTGVVMRNQATNGYARELIEQRQHRLPDRSTDVLEVDVDALWAGCRKLHGKIGCLVIDRRVEVEFVFNECALLGTARYAHRFRPRNFSELKQEHRRRQ